MMEIIIGSARGITISRVIDPCLSMVPEQETSAKKEILNEFKEKGVRESEVSFNY